MTPEEFQSEFGVSRETVRMLNDFERLLLKWQARVNLIGPSTVGDIWARHFGDSAQLRNLAPERAIRWADIGTGAGFPGMVLAILLRDRPGFEMHLIESNSKKAAFLDVVRQQIKCPVVVHNIRAEDLTLKDIDVITARACAPLDRLLNLAEGLKANQTICLFLKGQKSQSELTTAEKYWTIRSETILSRFDSSGSVLKISSFEPNQNV